ncbi:AP-1-like transcription factor [Podospora fimiseda]|uniref:AP-1-like transcription factor n=1 Tax=Podospora fimiseda TaxID=252190 RepID=A0AAN7BN85_9PEZI|nr:AP-1-like transcription factor [Podospora fimiseda]
MSQYNPNPSDEYQLISHGIFKSDRVVSCAARRGEASMATTSAFSSSTEGSLLSSSSAAPPVLASASTTGNPIPVNGGTKRRKAAPGTRGVANLTPEQLAKKRANDREAQRAIRERQRQKIEQYEREIQELRAQPPYQELQAVTRQKQAAEAELAEVKAVLKGIMAMVQPIIATPGPVAPVDQSSAPHPLSPAQTQQHPSPHPCPSIATAQAQSSTSFNAGSTPSSAASPPSAGYHHNRWSNSLSPIVPPMSSGGGADQTISSLSQQQPHNLVHNLDLGPDRLGLDFLLDPNHKIARLQPNGAQDSPQYRHAPMKHDWTTGGATISSIIPPRNNKPPSSHSSFQTHPRRHRPPHSQPPPISVPFPQNTPPTCPLDSILLDFLSERRQRFTDGQLSPSEIIGPKYPSVSSLLNPSISIYSHPLSKVFTDILARFPLLSGLPERVAVLYLMFLLMRWQVSPTRENYERMPVWFRPLRIQTERKHPAWLDHIPFPGMRERVIELYFSGESEGGFPFENFFIPFTGTLSVNWGYEDTDCLLRMPRRRERDEGEEEDEEEDEEEEDNDDDDNERERGRSESEEDEGDLMINPVFERHLGRLENWTLGEEFERAFPCLVGTFRLK